MTTDTTRAKYYKRLGLRPPPSAITPVLVFGNSSPLLRNPQTPQPYNSAINIAANFNTTNKDGSVSSSFSTSESFDPSHFRKPMSPSPSRSTTPSPSSSYEPSSTASFYAPSSSLFSVPSSSPSTASNSPAITPSTTPSTPSTLTLNITFSINNNNGGGEENNVHGIVIDSGSENEGYDSKAYFFSSLPLSGSPSLYSVPIEIPATFEETPKTNSGSEPETPSSLKTSRTFSPPHEYIKHLRQQMDSGDLSQSYFERPSKKYNVFSNYT